ncbi:hypothetical protein J6524_04910 [Bradyrhizobium sp. WSM 1738]|uniref:hypothetical protein n=1 Tax=Bradyrhizobium hereditatis TaxID=2821405 RepID=UPI001CE277C4|nr:hypothetical protein [Bradyrhizobium hereditatis]MCA6114269.1 hypothetical protein [Bradyrhizobium hereditatis]
MEDDQEIFERHAENHRQMRAAERGMDAREFNERRAYAASQALTKDERRRWRLP